MIRRLRKNANKQSTRTINYFDIIASVAANKSLHISWSIIFCITTYIVYFLIIYVYIYYVYVYIYYSIYGLFLNLLFLIYILVRIFWVWIRLYILWLRYIIQYLCLSLQLLCIVITTFYFVLYNCFERKITHKIFSAWKIKNAGVPVYIKNTQNKQIYRDISFIHIL